MYQYREEDVIGWAVAQNQVEDIVNIEVETGRPGLQVEKIRVHIQKLDHALYSIDHLSLMGSLHSQGQTTLWKLVDSSFQKGP